MMYPSVNVSALIFLACVLSICVCTLGHTYGNGELLEDVMKAILERLDEKDEQIWTLESSIESLRTQNELLTHELDILKERQSTVERGFNGDRVENSYSGNGKNEQAINAVLAENSYSQNEITQRKITALLNTGRQTKTKRQSRKRRQANLAAGVSGGGTVAFFATLINNIHHEAEGDLVPFDNVVTNEGSAYRPNPGQFVAPAPGLYVFSVTLQSYPVVGQPPSGYALNKNGVEVSKLYIDGSTTIDNLNYETTSQTAVLRLDKGDVIAVTNSKLRRP
ncbi:uncharacterized protein LOC127874521 isoform X2 [Dreissena polymorpha]|uniref:uncharacterized protein LOC127874521 isoform X2 n=1 Tax=Dreissena polymorpha TaxID=45954 RepID=UPI002263BE1D|nr:uncharacterized protein LOC127874521 isoform X2 [Dreissena polymorpha]